MFILLLILQLHYYQQGKYDAFVLLLENSRTGKLVPRGTSGLCYLPLSLSPSDADINYPDHDKDQMAAFDTLAAYYVQQARKEKDKEMRKDFFSQVEELYML